MRIIRDTEITDVIERLFLKANKVLSPDLEKCIRDARNKETSPLAASILDSLSDNLDAARQLDVPICQDTGIAVVFCDIGADIHIDGNLTDAINEGVRRAYLGGHLRLSVVKDPLFNRVNTSDNTPAIVHVRIVEGDKITLTAVPKGFGSENKSALKMFTPSATPTDIVNFVCETVIKAGGDPCPPLVIGVGVGGDFEYAPLLAKRALVRETAVPHPEESWAQLETDTLKAVNETGVGVQGFGGSTTALDVHYEYAPTHIAGLPVAVNIGCHVTRHASETL